MWGIALIARRVDAEPIDAGPAAELGPQSDRVQVLVQRHSGLEVFIDDVQHTPIFAVGQFADLGPEHHGRAAQAEVHPPDPQASLSLGYGFADVVRRIELGVDAVLDLWLTAHHFAGPDASASASPLLHQVADRDEALGLSGPTPAVFPEDARIAIACGRAPFDDVQRGPFEKSGARRALALHSRA